MEKFIRLTQHNKNPVYVRGSFVVAVEALDNNQGTGLLLIDGGYCTVADDARSVMKLLEGGESGERS